MSDLHPREDNPILAAWQQQLQNARTNPFLFQLLLKQLQRVLKRLAYFYAQLASLPRRKRRVLQRALATSLIGAAMLLALSSAPVVHAATITVDPGASGINPSDGCSLVEAIINANDDAATYAECVAGSGTDTIDLPPSATLDYLTYYGPPVSALPVVSSTIAINANNSTIQRNPAAPDDFNLLTVSPGGDLTLNDATLTGGFTTFFIGGGGILNYQGTLTLNNSTVTGNNAYFGGGISSIYGTTTLNDSAISNNDAYALGGGIFSVASEMNIYGTTISGNTATFGGGILHYFNRYLTADSSINLNTSTVANNEALLDGGGIFTGEISCPCPPPPAPPLAPRADESAPQKTGVFARLHQIRREHGSKLDLSTLLETSRNDPGLRVDLSALKASRNSGDYKRAARTHSAKRSTPRPERKGSAWRPKGKRQIFQPNGAFAPTDAAYYAVTVLYQSTIANNTAAYNGGGISNMYGGLTGIVNSTVSGNTATQGSGGGIDAYAGQVGLLNTTVTDNHADTAHGGGIDNTYAMSGMGRSLISGNTAATANEIYDYAGTINYSEFNVFGHDGETPAQAFENFVPTAADFDATVGGSYATPLNNILNPTLAFNGGPTQTHALKLGSPAVDKAPNADCLAVPLNGVDQRGLPRNVDISGTPGYLCDIGAFELQFATAANVTNVHGAAKPDRNVLKWQTTSESQIAGFNLFRKIGKQWKQVNTKFKQAKNPGSPQGNKYAFRDKKVKAGKTYRYKIEVKYLDGHSEWTEIVRVTTPR